MIRNHITSPVIIRTFRAYLILRYVTGEKKEISSHIRHYPHLPEPTAVHYSRRAAGC